MDIAPIARRVWDMKYRLKQADGTAVDKTVEDTWSRVAKALAAVEKTPETWAPRFLAALTDFRFLPGGRILAGAGTGRDVTLFNCFVMGTLDDSMEGIFTALRESAVTLQRGGGIGIDFSPLRPQGAAVAGSGADASGPVSFMDVWDAMCRTVMSAGARRGAMMATLRCDHPDIEAFVDAKRDRARLRNFNLSVLVTDPFMAAVEADTDWDLTFEGKTVRTVRARELWHRIMRATYDVAEPGVIFIDRINRANPLWYAESIQATNPCGEQPLPPHGACLLGSVNLARFVADPFGEAATLDTDALIETVCTAIRMMDNTIDVSRYPLPEQAAEARAKRRIGLGVTGLADALIMLGLRYDGAAARQAVDGWMALIQRTAYLTSADLAAEKGPFPLFDAARHLEGETVARLDADVRQAIAERGLRNALLTSIAPTGTISLFADNVSSGIEPVFAFEYTRAVLEADGSRTEETVTDQALRRYRRITGRAALMTEAFVDAQVLSPKAHLEMQAVVQRHVDSAISKTINVPADLPFDNFVDVYRDAYRLGCKGCTTYRPNEVTGSVLSVAPSAETAPRADNDTGRDDVVHLVEPLARPEALPGRTYKVRWPESDHALYITCNDIIQDGRRRPFEVFINSKNMEHYAWTVALTRMISAVFRRGGDIAFVVEELKAVFDPRGGTWMEGRYVPSMLAAIGAVIERHMIEIGFLEGDGSEAVAAPLKSPAPGRLGRGCPRCGQASLVRQEGCDTCLGCGYSRCG